MRAERALPSDAASPGSSSAGLEGTHINGAALHSARSLNRATQGKILELKRKGSVGGMHREMGGGRETRRSSPG